MLHRLALRVLPQLNALVTEPAVRKRKRWVMLVPGLVAFALYRLVKGTLPLSDPVLLLSFSGLLSSITALWAYRMGRGNDVVTIMEEDGLSRLAWIMGWIGFVYGLDLSLLVLALLKVFVNYDFLAHPDGPAMMAVIISCTAVTRDAFEIGFLRRCELEGHRLVTFPNGATFRTFVRLDPWSLLQWSGLAGVAGVCLAILVGFSGPLPHLDGMYACMISALAGSLALLAFWVGAHRGEQGMLQREFPTWWAIIRFWAWPCFTFALTYWMVLVGTVEFIVGLDGARPFLLGLMSAIAAGLVTGYCYFLGTRKYLERQVQGEIPDNLKSCPFVMNILTKAGMVTGQAQPEISSPSITGNPSERIT